jgi:hypothetical protein
LPTDPATGVQPATRAEEIAQLNANWRTIVRLVSVRRRPLLLSKRVSLPDGELVTVTARAELSGDLSQARINASTARAVLTFRLLDGCWFAEDASTFNVIPGQSVFLPANGTADTGNITVTLMGGVGVQTLTNVSAGVWLSYDWSTVGASDVITVDVPGFNVLRDTGGGPFASLTRFKHGGDDRFMLIDPDLGDNEFTLSSGKAVVSYREAYL